MSVFSPKVFSIIMLRQPLSFKDLPESVRFLRLHFLKDLDFLDGEHLFVQSYGYRAKVQKVFIEAHTF